MISRRAFSGLSVSAAFAASPKLNYILVLADDTGYGDIGKQTPHLNRLASGGIRFTDHYSCSPVCSPARAGLMTGLIPDRVGIFGVLREADDASHGLDLKTKTMADHFRAQGYKTALLGKWHLGMSEPYRPNRRGFDYFWGFLNGMHDYSTNLSAGGGGRGTRQTYENETPIELKSYFPALLARKAVEFIEANRDRPYFLYLATPLTHTPLQAPPDESASNNFEIYSAMLRYMDATIGQMREALERTGQWDRTVFIFLSDNGWVKKVTPDVAPVGSNGPLRGGKYELYEGGIRVPCIVRWPGLSHPGTTCSTPSWFPDWLPTLTGAKTRDGEDIRPLIAGKPGNTKRTLYWRFADRLVNTPLSYAARQGRWKRLDDELFDLAADPGEKHPIRSNRLRKELETFKAEVR
ncbi:MAG: sulfatase-like hydrolase/transferase [Acidobacteria bacterium]|nr:sulfatase-like hydrolase/transferase [Acidobacteriota bacterium]